MDQRLNPPLRAVALALFGLTAGLATSVPLLDAHEAFEQPGIEKSHDASRCAYRHDHNLCVVFQQSPAEATHSAPLRSPAAPEIRCETPRLAVIATAPHSPRHSARAPPVFL